MSALPHDLSCHPSLSGWPFCPTQMKRHNQELLAPAPRTSVLCHQCQFFLLGPTVALTDCLHPAHLQCEIALLPYANFHLAPALEPFQSQPIPRHGSTPLVPSRGRPPILPYIAPATIKVQQSRQPNGLEKTHYHFLKLVDFEFNVALFVL